MEGESEGDLFPEGGGEAKLGDMSEQSGSGDRRETVDLVPLCIMAHWNFNYYR